VDELERLTREHDRPPPRDTPAAAAGRRAQINALVHELRRIPTARADDEVVGCRLTSIVGKGNYGTVWHAIELASGEDRAVKIFDSERLGLGLSLYHFRRGVRAMEHLAAEGPPDSIVGLFAVDAAKLAFSMRYLPGGNLYDWIKRSWEQSAKLVAFRITCLAVKFAHDHRVLHRDIKPANIVMTLLGEPVLTDFDIADLLFVETQSVTAAGTVRYAAPEQLKQHADENRPDKEPWKKARNPTGDIFSLGRLLHFLLEGKDPELFIEKVPVLAEIASKPEGLVRIVRKCTLYDPAGRYQCVSDLLADLDKYASEPKSVGVDSLEPPPGGQPPPRDPLWRNGAFMGAAGVVGAALITALATQYPRQERTPRAGNANAPGTTVQALSDIRPAVPAVPAGAPASPDDRLKPPPEAIVTENGGVWLVEIPGGTFTMGSPVGEEGREQDENQHRVTVSPFLIGKFEVTNQQYARFLAAHPETDKPENWIDSLPSDEPVSGVSWQQSDAFARWAGGRLPTEAEWEYAARSGGIESRYGSLSDIAWYGGNSGARMHPVGLKQANAFALYDMLGNVWEWCADWYDSYDKRPVIDPSGPATGLGHVVRGGAWGNGKVFVRAAGRRTVGLSFRDQYVGFRLVKSGSSKRNE
jgi:formylglycine-generating enzyme required for sulfatase activity/tRNA A-37 threonylcarbamoyl transferase component Bud32